MMDYPPTNPQAKRAPVLRPDFVIQRNGKVSPARRQVPGPLGTHASARDALSAGDLRAESRAGRKRGHPLSDAGPGGREARIDIRDPVRGAGRSTVVLRPVDMLELSRLVAVPPKATADASRRQFAALSASDKRRSGTATLRDVGSSSARPDERQQTGCFRHAARRSRPPTDCFVLGFRRQLPFVASVWTRTVRLASKESSSLRRSSGQAWPPLWTNSAAMPRPSAHLRNGLRSRRQ